ncbi:TIGR01777 family protein [Pseudoalteromonas sp. NBT06-2]|uniref:TIGR01777 family oxidoreductase n=1 Tax=Pseudoalteromonas sp. NBT06-2 TaxID=2025950 RepID=UPI000BA79E7B|nr:TIGR01777 family oxidoreductase [Pseudoalteromonas sp. NBT06-2]PAJ74230.1 TIGR01777 family protein [Pseudoalteromonas sp. NBT06-2]
MNILITGGTGLIGSALIPFLDNHHKVTILTRNATKVYVKIGSHIQAINKLSEINFNQLDIIINLAGEAIADKRWSKKQKQKIEQSRWQLTQDIVDEIEGAETPPHTFISGSAIGFYGRQNNHPIDESFNECTQEFSHTLCKEWESIAQRASSDKTRVCILRTGIVLSSQGGALTKMLPAYKFALGGPIADGSQIMSWIHIDDLIGIIMYLVEETTLKGIFNATAPNPVSNAEFSSLLAESLKRPNFFRVPAKILTLILGEMAELLIYGQNVQPNNIIKVGYRFHYPQLKEAFLHLLRHHSE